MFLKKCWFHSPLPSDFAHTEVSVNSSRMQIFSTFPPRKQCRLLDTLRLAGRMGHFQFCHKSACSPANYNWKSFKSEGLDPASIKLVSLPYSNDYRIDFPSFFNVKPSKVCSHLPWKVQVHATSENQVLSVHLTARILPHHLILHLFWQKPRPDWQEVW